MQHASIATFAALLCFAAVYCSPTRPQEEPSQMLERSQLEPRADAAAVPEDQRQKRQIIITTSPWYPNYGYSYSYPIYPYSSPVYLFRKRRDVSGANVNEEPAREEPAKEPISPPEEIQRGKRQAIFYSSSWGYPAYPYVYPRYYNPYFFYKR